jgi:1-acyl-sn-glycerol-3-phosphate acyltransferase
LALNSGLFWPRRSVARYPGTIVIEVLDPIPPGLPRAEARKLIQERIEAACARLIAEALAAPNPPPPANAARRHAAATMGQAEST